MRRLGTILFIQHDQTHCFNATLAVSTQSNQFEFLLIYVLTPYDQRMLKWLSNNFNAMRHAANRVQNIG